MRLLSVLGPQGWHRSLPAQPLLSRNLARYVTRSTLEGINSTPCRCGPLVYFVYANTKPKPRTLTQTIAVHYFNLSSPSKGIRSLPTLLCLTDSDSANACVFFFLFLFLEQHCFLSFFLFKESEQRSILQLCYFDRIFPSSFLFSFFFFFFFLFLSRDEDGPYFYILYCNISKENFLEETGNLTKQ